MKKKAKYGVAVRIFCIGAVVGLSVSMILFSCSTPQQTQSSVYAVPNLASLQDSFREVAAQALMSVVRIDVVQLQSQTSPSRDGTPWFDFFFGEPDNSDPRDELKTQGLGSGVIVRKKHNTYYVLTNEHVLGNATEIQITLDDGRQYMGNIVGIDSRKDLAMLSFESVEDIPLAVLGDSDSLHVGDWVLAVGTPLGFQSTVTIGIVSALGRHGGPESNISDFIQTDAAINRGNSGGALVNLHGEVVGINTWISTIDGGSLGLGFSIPINNIVRAIDSFVETGSVRYGWLGVSIRSIDEEIQEEMGLRTKNGALVYHLFFDSPADKGKMIPGDFVININEEPIRNADDLILKVGELPVGEVATFIVLRGGKEKNLSVRIEERESDQEIAELNTRLWPGFSVYPITDEYREEAELKDTVKGLLVTVVENRTIAESADLHPTDILLALNGSKIETMADFFAALAKVKGDMSLFVLRDGEEREIAVKRK